MASGTSTETGAGPEQEQRFARKWLKFITGWTIVVGLGLWWAGFLLTVRSGPWTEI
jgi:hypothetical protein